LTYDTTKNQKNNNHIGEAAKRYMLKKTIITSVKLQKDTCLKKQYFILTKLKKTYNYNYGLSIKLNDNKHETGISL
jgi:hypothetical protein